MSATSTANPTSGGALATFTFLAMLVSALLYLSFPPIGEKAWLVFHLLATAYFVTHFRDRLFSVPCLLFGGALLAQTISWAASHHYHPDYAESSLKLHRMGAWFSFILVASVLANHPQRLIMMWCAFIAGLLATPWTTGDGLTEILNGLNGARVDFGINNAQHTGMLFGTILIGSIAFTPWVTKQTIIPKRIALGSAILLTALCGAVVLMTSTRAIIIGVAAAVITMAGISAVTQPQRSKFVTSMKLGVAAGVSTGVFLVVLGISHSDTAPARWQQQSSTIQAILQNDLQNMPNDGVGIRFKSWLEATQWIKAEPITGWGGKGRKLVLEHSQLLPNEIKKQFSHLHNSYIDTLVNYGINGLAILLLLYAWLIRRSWAAWTSGTSSKPMLIFFSGFMAFWIIVNTFESYIYFSTGSIMFSLVAGSVLSHIWRTNNDSSHTQNYNRRIAS